MIKSSQTHKLAFGNFLSKLLSKINTTYIPFNQKHHNHLHYMIMEIKIQSTQFVKPSTSTPQNLQYFKLSALDQLAPSSNINMIFYYKTRGANELDIPDRNRRLVKSLSDALNVYYPFAGRLTRDRLRVDCSDQGVKYLETRASIRLDDFLNHGPDVDQVGRLVNAPDLVTNALLAVQVNVFDCGSLVIGVSASHKVTDAYNLTRFVNEWASVNRIGSENVTYRPSFDHLERIFQPLDISNISSHEHSPVAVEQKPVMLTKRYVFNGTAISNLRAKAGPESSKQSTRVTLVSSLIWKALIDVDRVKTGRFRDCLLSPAISLRGKRESPVSETSFGNVWIPYPIRFLQNETENKFLDLVGLIERTTRKIVKWVVKASGEEICKQAKAWYNEAYDEVKQNKFCIITSWCKFPIYEADFGWGKPCWVSGAGRSLDMVTLMDDENGDGIEAWVSLNEKDMKLFEQDEDIIAFTS
ncbi:hypothetical protein SSX86_009632 [Deinandra increscens subsp. villosa]|uniref:BAHD acyltransferase n=1 Tax=Deinandra increscens subsp. villosa TaxID=3103831 RepID=A0AAP0DHA4_9ASTR